MGLVSVKVGQIPGPADNVNDVAPQGGAPQGGPPQGGGGGGTGSRWSGTNHNPNNASGGTWSVQLNWWTPYQAFLNGESATITWTGGAWIGGFGTCTLDSDVGRIGNIVVTDTKTLLMSFGGTDCGSITVALGATLNVTGTVYCADVSLFHVADLDVSGALRLWTDQVRINARPLYHGGSDANITGTVDTIAVAIVFNCVSCTWDNARIIGGSCTVAPVLQLPSAATVSTCDLNGGVLRLSGGVSTAVQQNGCGAVNVTSGSASVAGLVTPTFTDVGGAMPDVYTVVSANRGVSCSDQNEKMINGIKYVCTLSRGQTDVLLARYSCMADSVTNTAYPQFPVNGINVSLRDNNGNFFFATTTNLGSFAWGTPGSSDTYVIVPGDLVITFSNLPPGSAINGGNVQSLHVAPNSFTVLTAGNVGPDFHLVPV